MQPLCPGTTSHAPAFCHAAEMLTFGGVLWRLVIEGRKGFARQRVRVGQRPVALHARTHATSDAPEVRRGAASFTATACSVAQLRAHSCFGWQGRVVVACAPACRAGGGLPGRLRSACRPPSPVAATRPIRAPPSMEWVQEGPLLARRGVGVGEQHSVCMCGPPLQGLRAGRLARVLMRRGSRGQPDQAFLASKRAKGAPWPCEQS